MTEDQWEKLAAFIKSEATAAVCVLDSSAELIRREYEQEAHDALVKELQP